MSSSDKMLSILSLFSAEVSEWTVEQAATALRATISTTYRYFGSLSRAGMIAPIKGGRYVLGPAAIQFDWLIRRSDPLLLASAPAMDILARAITRPAVILLCRLYHGQVMCVAEQATGNPSFASGYQRGRPMPLFRGAGSKAILAHMPIRTVRSIQARHRAEMDEAGLGGDWKSVLAALRRVREKGYCVTRGEIDPGLIGIATPILQSPKVVVGSISFVLAERDEAAVDLPMLGRLIWSAGQQISEAMGIAISMPIEGD